MTSGIAEGLSGRRRVFFDTASIVYFIEANPRFEPLVRPAFELVAAGDVEGLTSVIVLAEVLVQPLKHGRADLARTYADCLLRSRGFTCFPVDATVARSGAALRAAQGLRLPDALNLAIAEAHGADAFLTNDFGLRNRSDRLDVGPARRRGATRVIRES